MIKSRWVKVFNDLWGSKTRTMLIVLSIAVGLFAVGTIVSAQVILSEGMAESFAAAVHPAGATPEVVSAALDWYYRNEAERAAALDEADESFRQESERKLREELGRASSGRSTGSPRSSPTRRAAPTPRAAPRSMRDCSAGGRPTAGSSATTRT